MHTIQSIGSLSEHVLSHDERSKHTDSRRSDKKLSQQLIEEKHRLFGEPSKRQNKNILPQSRKTLKDVKNISRESLEEIFLEVLSKLNDQFDTSYSFEDMIEAYKHEHKRHRMMTCQIIYHCWHIKQSVIAEIFEMHRDLQGTANHMLGRQFSKSLSDYQNYLSVFDYFMNKNGKIYL
jgi:hypothetical protein